MRSISLHKGAEEESLIWDTQVEERGPQNTEKTQRWRRASARISQGLKMWDVWRRQKVMTSRCLLNPCSLKCIMKLQDLWTFKKWCKLMSLCGVTFTNKGGKSQVPHVHTVVVSLGKTLHPACPQCLCPLWVNESVSGWVFPFCKVLLALERWKSEVIYHVINFCCCCANHYPLELNFYQWNS